jgi:hypothetical protein
MNTTDHATDVARPHPWVRPDATPVKRPEAGRRYFVTHNGSAACRPETGVPTALYYHGKTHKTGGWHAFNGPNYVYLPVDGDVRFYSLRDDARDAGY